MAGNGRPRDHVESQAGPRIAFVDPHQFIDAHGSLFWSWLPAELTGCVLVSKELFHESS
jgi:hypothetical protein